MANKSQQSKSFAAKAPRGAKSDGADKPARVAKSKEAAEQGAESGAKAVKLKDLVDQVVEATGAKRAEAKPLVEATLARLAAVLARGESLSLQGIGNFRVSKPATEETPVVRLKLRLAGARKAKAQTDAED